MLKGAGCRNYLLLSGFVFCFFLAQAAAVSLLSIWLSQTLGLSGAQAGFVFSVNFVAAMLSQPIYDFIPDRMGPRRTIPIAIAGLVALAGPLLRPTSTPPSPPRWTMMRAMST